MIIKFLNINQKKIFNNLNDLIQKNERIICNEKVMHDKFNSEYYDDIQEFKYNARPLTSDSTFINKKRCMHSMKNLREKKNYEVTFDYRGNNKKIHFFKDLIQSKNFKNYNVEIKRKKSLEKGSN